MNPWVVGVTSCFHGEGKTTVSIGLAVALAEETGERVALIEANFQNPTLAADFGVVREPGLSDYLMDTCPLWKVGKATGVDQLTLFPAGNPSGAFLALTTEMVQGWFRRRLPEIVRHLGEEFPYVVLDLPPILGGIDAEEMLHSVNGEILLVARTGVTPLEQFRQAAQHLENQRLLGVVHLGDQTSIPRWLSQLISE